MAPYARQASGRYSILNRMLRMSVGDIIFVPATSAVPGEEQDFSVATIAAPYKFSPRVDAPKFTFLRDYGHVIQVNELQAVPYSARTLAGTDFRPHRYAVNGPIAKKSRDRYLRCLRDLGYVVGP